MSNLSGVLLRHENGLFVENITSISVCGGGPGTCAGFL